MNPSSCCCYCSATFSPPLPSSLTPFSWAIFLLFLWFTARCEEKRGRDANNWKNGWREWEKRKKKKKLGREVSLYSPSRDDLIVLCPFGLCSVCICKQILLNVYLIPFLWAPHPLSVDCFSVAMEMENREFSILMPNLAFCMITPRCTRTGVPE